MAAVVNPRGGEHKGDGKGTTEIKLRLPEQIASGVYANSMMVQHTGDEFIMDFAMMVGGAGTVVARIVTSPGHAKRIAAALEDNLRKYETTHGPITGPKGRPSQPKGSQPPVAEDE